MTRKAEEASKVEVTAAGQLIYTIEVSEEKLVRFRELKVIEFEACVKEAGGGSDDWDLTNAGVRRSIVEIAGQPISYEDVMGPLIGNYVTTKELLILRQAWSKVHLPQPEDMERVRAIRVG